VRSLVVRYRAFLLVSVVLLGLSLLDRELGQQVYDTTAYQLREMILVIPPIFILLGLLDIWVPKQTMVRFMGEGSGLKGVLLALFIGSAAAGPLYGAFPVAAVFMKKGVKLSNILIFLGAWSTTKIPMLLFEFTALGVPFALTRLLVNLPGIIIIAAILEKLMSQKEKDSLYERAQSL